MFVTTKRGLSRGSRSPRRTTSALMMTRRAALHCARRIVGVHVEMLGLLAARPPPPASPARRAAATRRCSPSPPRSRAAGCAPRKSNSAGDAKPPSSRTRKRARGNAQRSSGSSRANRATPPSEATALPCRNTAEHRYCSGSRSERQEREQRQVSRVGSWRAAGRVRWFIRALSRRASVRLP